MDWNQVLAALINSVLVLIVVQFLKSYGIPWLNEKAPFLLPVIAMVIGPLMAYLAGTLSAWLGWPIDFGPITGLFGLFTGAGAVALHQVGRQFQKAAA